MDLSGIAIMLARQRSGTNALRQVLDAHPDVFTTPEVMHPEPAGSDLISDMNFFRFVERHPEGLVTRARSAETQERVFLDFLEFLRGFSDKRVMLIDIKLNSSHHFDGPWRSVAGPPDLFGLIRRHKIRTLHLTRRNYLRYFLSSQKAKASDTWAAKDETRDTRVRVDITQLLWWMSHAHAEELETTQTLSQRKEWLSFDYDDMFAEMGAPIATEILDWIAGWLDVASDRFPRRDPFFRKQSALGLAETIENYAEVEQALRGTPFEYCLEDERVYRAGGTG